MRTMTLGSVRQPEDAPPHISTAGQTSTPQNQVLILGKPSVFSESQNTTPFSERVLLSPSKGILGQSGTERPRSVKRHRRAPDLTNHSWDRLFGLCEKAVWDQNGPSDQIVGGKITGPTGMFHSLRYHRGKCRSERIRAAVKWKIRVHPQSGLLFCQLWRMKWTISARLSRSSPLGWASPDSWLAFKRRRPRLQRTSSKSSRKILRRPICSTRQPGRTSARETTCVASERPTMRLKLAKTHGGRFGYREEEASSTSCSTDAPFSAALLPAEYGSRWAIWRRCSMSILLPEDTY